MGNVLVNISFTRLALFNIQSKYFSFTFAECAALRAKRLFAYAKPRLPPHPSNAVKTLLMIITDPFIIHFAAAIGIELLGLV